MYRLGNASHRFDVTKRNNIITESKEKENAQGVSNGLCLSNVYV